MDFVARNSWVLAPEFRAGMDLVILFNYTLELERGLLFDRPKAGIKMEQALEEKLCCLNMGLSRAFQH